MNANKTATTARSAPACEKGCYKETGRPICCLNVRWRRMILQAALLPRYNLNQGASMPIVGCKRARNRLSSPGVCDIPMSRYGNVTAMQCSGTARRAEGKKNRGKASQWTHFGVVLGFFASTMQGCPVEVQRLQAFAPSGKSHFIYCHQPEANQ